MSITAEPLLLTSCGFHLRAPVELPAEISPLYIEMKGNEMEGNDAELVRELRTLLSQSGHNNLAAMPEASKARLNILNVRESKRVVSVDTRGRVREYELTYAVRYSVSGKRVLELAGSTDDAVITRELKLKRELLFDPDSVLAASHEQETLLKAMRKDAARLILQQLKAMGAKSITENVTE